MATLTCYPPTHNLMPDMRLPNKGFISNYLCRNQVTQVSVEIVVSNTFANLMDRLKDIEHAAHAYNLEIPNQIFQNAKFTLDKLSPYLKFLEADEIGPSSYNTLLFNFEKEDKSLLLDIGINNIAYVFSDSTDQIRSNESSLNDDTFWSELDVLFRTEF